MKKSLIAILMTAVILLSLMVPLISIPTVQAQDPSAWYMTVPGVLSSDYYVLYPYSTNASLKIGFSKFGELINSNDNTGLEYRDVDPFAPPAGTGLTTQVPKRMWVQGWFINITYRHRTLGDRNVWAMAMHSDSIAYGNDWIRVDFANDRSTAYGVEDPRDPGSLIYGPSPYATTPSVQGGRKTNGTAVTPGYTVLYNGPREFVAMCTTTIYDHPLFLDNSTASDIALVKIVITIVFDKVKKEVKLLKDVKTLLAWKEGEKMKIEFSNRGEVDLGTDAATYGSYAHFWTQGTKGAESEDPRREGLLTYYNSSWTLMKTEDPLDTEYTGFSADGPYPQDGYWATYDVAQAINTRAGYVWFGAFWPSLSDWSIDGWDQWWHSLHIGDPHYIDYRTPTEEPFIPFYIGEWDFVLWHTFDALNRTQFRGVTVYGVVDFNNADDENMGTGHSNILDKEAGYQLNQVFTPWDMEDALDLKYTSRWVTFVLGPKTAGSTIALPGIIQVTWDAYKTLAEKLITLPDNILWKRGINYTLTATGVTLITALPAGKTLKILWSNRSWEIIDGVYYGPARYEWVTVGRDAASVDSLGAALMTSSIKQKNFTIGIAGEDMFDPMVANQIPSIMYKFGVGTAKADYKDSPSTPWNQPGYRAALKDDWCTKWPIASSNIIGVGGPLAHMLAYYANDFTEAFYGLKEYAGTLYSEKVVPITCWNRGWIGTWNVYSSSSTTGYAVITTHIDINGTVLFMVWGHWGRDTYYASQWLHGDVARGIPPGIVQLQSAPWGLTSIILKIDYTKPEHPTFRVVECLGTISETLWVHGTESKGGIHDP